MRRWTNVRAPVPGLQVRSGASSTPLARLAWGRLGMHMHGAGGYRHSGSRPGYIAKQLPPGGANAAPLSRQKGAIPWDGPYLWQLQ